MANKKSRFLVLNTIFLIFFIIGCGGGGGSATNGSDTNSNVSLMLETLSPLTTARAELGVATVNGKIYAIGGISGSTLSSVEEYNPLTNTWTTKAAMPTKRRLMVVAAVNNKIYAIGGVDGSNPNNITYKNVTEEYDPATDTWTTKSPFPLVAASNHVLGNQYIGGAAAGGKIYIVSFTAGGFSGSQSPTYIYDPSTDTWDTGEPVPFTYTRYSVTSLNDTIYVMACYGLISDSLRMARYDADSDTWIKVSSPGVSRNNAQIVAANGKIYAIGGISSDYDHVMSNVEEYNPTTNQWRAVGNIATARWSAGLAALNGEVYIIGGSQSSPENDISPLASVEASSNLTSIPEEDTGGDPPTGDTAPLLTARAELGVATVNGKIYAIGGISGSTLSSLEEYNPLTDIWTSKAPMPTKRRLMVVAAVNNKIYAIGGVNGSTSSVTRTNVTEEYDPATDTWTTKSPFPIPAAFNNLLSNQYIGGAAVGGKIYIVSFGNKGDSRENPTYIYDPSTDTWDTGEPVPFTYTRYSVTSLNDTIYVMACNGLISDSLRMAKYDADSDAWIMVSSPSVNRNNAQIVAANGKIYAIGGISSDYNHVMSNVEEYNPTTNQWRAVGNIATARWSAGLAALNGEVYIIGGSQSPEERDIFPLSSVEVKD